MKSIKELLLILNKQKQLNSNEIKSLIFSLNKLGVSWGDIELSFQKLLLESICQNMTHTIKNNQKKFTFQDLSTTLLALSRMCFKYSNEESNRVILVLAYLFEKEFANEKKFIDEQNYYQLAEYYQAICYHNISNEIPLYVNSEIIKIGIKYYQENIIQSTFKDKVAAKIKELTKANAINIVQHYSIDCHIIDLVIPDLHLAILCRHDYDFISTGELIPLKRLQDCYLEKRGFEVFSISYIDWQKNNIKLTEALQGVFDRKLE